MKIEGYKLSGYDATYRKAVFNVVERKNRVLEVTDAESGQVFILDFSDTEDRTGQVGAWRGQDVKGQGKTIHFGRMGFFKELEYNTKKRRKGK